MQYTVNLYQADANGTFIAKAYTPSALQRPLFDKHTGVCTRDTKLQDAQMPQWTNRLDSKSAVIMAYTFFFLQAASNKPIGNCALLLNDITALRSRANNAPLDLSALITDIHDKGVCLLDVVMSYPRWVKCDGSIEVGGMFYFDKLLDDMNPQKTQGVHVATVEERENLRMDALAKKGLAATESYAMRERYSRGTIDEMVAQFCDLISELGQKACCNSAATNLNGRVKALVELLGSCGINNFLPLEAACNDAENVLSMFCRALAQKQDVAAQAPVKAVLVGRSAELLSTINKNTRPRTDKGRKHRHTARGWRTQADVATDFSKQAKKIGGRWYGKVTKDKMKDWESRYPNETKREPKSGYHAGLRTTANPTPEVKTAYFNAATDWNKYWQLHNEAFSAWLKANPNGDHALFLKTWERPGKTVHRNDTDKTKLYGANTSFTDALDSGEFDNGT